MWQSFLLSVSGWSAVPNPAALGAEILPLFIGGRLVINSVYQPK